MRLSAKILSMLVVGILLTLPAFGQAGDGVVSGKVIGRDGMPAANVIIRVQRMNSLNAIQRVVAQTFETKTGKNGVYSQGTLPQGTYQVVLMETGRIILADSAAALKANPQVEQAYLGGEVGA